MNLQLSSNMTTMISHNTLESQRGRCRGKPKVYGVATSHGNKDLHIAIDDDGIIVRTPMMKVEQANYPNALSTIKVIW
jgi:hypothetical protein